MYTYFPYFSGEEAREKDETVPTNESFTPIATHEQQVKKKPFFLRSDATAIEGMLWTVYCIVLKLVGPHIGVCRQCL